MLLGNLGDRRSFSLVYNLEQFLEGKRSEYSELVALFQGAGVFCIVLNMLYHNDFPIVLIQKLFGCIGLFPTAVLDYFQPSGTKFYSSISIYR